MGLKVEKILGIPVNTSSQKEILEYVKKYLVKNSKLKTQNSRFSRKPLVIFTPNP
jgi:hypothetical protein